ncbi:5-formyltetrahydrofolate cyclo-ligase [Sediminitomix flava]|uniref:5-formyltetrahydrofolate cyclo-ligase n=1 Tax=Sediminitomix flava TaxID=379075 RepID=A0A315ZA32_SEDFL|nr:5-formyltetrahydrofolate cyclo-ligase [Sediminitomix flava]PWJ41064.1 5-formyltetrahydrofolate cyclo-ligase [Sediminitomix flava]
MFAAQKAELRKEILKQRKELSTEEVNAQAEKLTVQLIDFVEKENVSCVHTYLPIQNELNTLPFVEYCLSKGIKIIVPKTLGERQMKNLDLESLEDLVEGKYKTLYPKSEKVFEGNYDMIIVPALAYDTNGGRLGYGAGYYDTFLKQHPHAVKIGLAYPFQVVESVPMEEHDVPLDMLFA